MTNVDPPQRNRAGVAARRPTGRSWQPPFPTIPRDGTGAPLPGVAAGLCLLLLTASAVQFRAVVDRVRIDFVAVDNDGSFVDDLRPEEIVVTEDGVRQEIVELQLIDLQAGDVVPLLVDEAARTPGVGGDTRPAGRGARVGSVDVDAPGATLVEELGSVVVVVDLHGLDFKNERRFAAEWERSLAHTERLAVPWTVYAIDQVGRLEQVVAPTLDLHELRSAPSRIAEADIGVYEQVGRLAPDDRASQEPPEGGADVAGSESPFAEPRDAGEKIDRFNARSRSLYIYDLLTRFADAMRARRGRSALIWVSPGVTLGGVNPDPQIIARQEGFHRAASSSNVAVYSVDPALLTERAGGGIDMSDQEAPALDTRPPTRAGSPQDELGNSLRHAARATGGRHFIAWAEIPEVFEEIRRDTARYYLITYATPEPVGDGEYHEVEIETTRRGVTVRAGEGYVDLPPETRRSRRIDAALAVPGGVGNLDVAAEPYVTFGPDGTGAVTMLASVDAARLTKTGDPDGARRATATLHAAVFRAGEEEASVRADETVSGLVGDAARPDTGPLRLSHIFDWELAPGEYEVRVVAADEMSERIGSASVPLRVPARSTGDWSASDLLVLEADLRGTSRPVVAGTTVVGRALYAYAEVAGATSPEIGGRIVSDEAAIVIELPATAMQLEGERHVGLLALPYLEPGSYRLQIRITDAPADGDRDFERHLHIVEARRR